MKRPCSLVSFILIGTVSLSYGQNFDPGTFFAPDLRVQHGKTDAVVAVEVDNTVIGGNEASGNVTWTLGAGGYAGVTVTPLLGVHLGAYTETTGNSLVFGRDLDFDGLASLLQTQLTSVLNANVLSTWSATADVTGLDIDANQLYQVTFDISSGDALDASLLSTAGFNITSDDVTSFGNGTDGLLNVLGVVTIGEDPSTGQGMLLFSSSTDRSDLQFQFDATSLVRLGLLGGVAGNQNVLTFSNIQVQAIPEPSAFVLSAFFAGGLALRRRRGK